MGVTLEKIDLIRSRANVTYEEAKQALEMCNFDEIEALIYLEKNQKTTSTGSYTQSQSQAQTQKIQEGPTVWEQIKTFIKKVHAVKFVVEKNQTVVINIPLTLLIISLLILFPFIITLLILGLVFGYKMTFVKSKTESYEVNAIIDSTFEKVRATAHQEQGQGQASPSEGETHQEPRV